MYEKPFMFNPYFVEYLLLKSSSIFLVYLSLNWVGNKERNVKEITRIWQEYFRFFLLRRKERILWHPAYMSYSHCLS